QAVCSRSVSHRWMECGTKDLQRLPPGMVGRGLAVYRDSAVSAGNVTCVGRRGYMSSCMPSWQECQEDCPGVLVHKTILHRREAKVPVCNLPLLYTSCPCVVPIIPLPGISLPGFASRHAKEWFHIRQKKRWYRNRFSQCLKILRFLRLCLLSQHIRT